MTKVILSDAVLVRQYASGNEWALAQLIERHQARIFGFIFSKVKDRDLANDIFQETFIKVINTIRKGSYKEEGKFLLWVMRIARNLIIDHFRKVKKMQLQRDYDDFSIFDGIEDRDKNIEAKLIYEQIEDELQVLILRLPKEQQEIIRLRLYEDLSFKEIAELTGLSINTALGRMRYALMNLRKIIEQGQNIIKSTQ